VCGETERFGCLMDEWRTGKGRRGRRMVGRGGEIWFFGRQLLMHLFAATIDALLALVFLNLL
jgi:hypothetical protein